MMSSGEGEDSVQRGVRRLGDDAHEVRRVQSGHDLCAELRLLTFVLKAIKIMERF